MNLRRRFGHLRMIGSDALEQFGHAMQVGARGDADGDLVSRLQRKFFELLIQLSFSVAQLKIAKRFWIEALYFKKDVPPVSPSSRPKNTVQPQPECLVGFHVAPIFMPPHASR